MGQAISSVLGTKAETLPVTEKKQLYTAAYGGPRHPEASTDKWDWYTDLFEIMYCIPHRDGKSMIIFEPHYDDEYPNPRARPDWAIKRLRKAYELLERGHPRIVRCIGNLENSTGVLVEKVNPGPMCCELPAISLPLPSALDRRDKIMLSSYYRWALQVLSAFTFMHSRSVYVRNFSPPLVWVRSDYSLAITGFICATAPEIEQEFWRDAELSSSYWDKAEWFGEDSMMCDDFAIKHFDSGSVKEDL